MGGGASDSWEGSRGDGLARGVEALAVGVEVAEGGGEGEWRVCEDDFGSEAGDRGEES